MNLCCEIKSLPLDGCHHLSQPFFVRLDLSQKYPSDNPWPKFAMPILYLPEGHSKEVAECHATYAQSLAACGVKKCVIAADEDGALQRSLSPRYSPVELQTRFDLLRQTYLAVTQVMDEVWVLLTVEELAPGGIDATDGVQIARALADLGLTTIIATAGTKDFPPLYDRRATQRKDSSQESFYSNEPALASALWLLQGTNLSVWCLAFLDDDDKAVKLAESIGLAGLIKKAKEEI